MEKACPPPSPSPHGSVMLEQFFGRNFNKVSARPCADAIFGSVWPCLAGAVGELGPWPLYDDYKRGQ